MSPRTEKQFEEIREERKAQIKEVALEIIFEEGFQNTSISKISKRAGISKGLLYNYYKSKEDMIREIVFDGLDNFMRIFDPDKDGILTDEEARFFIDETFNILKSNIKYWRLYFSVMLQPKVMSLIQDRFVKVMEPFMNILISFFKYKGSENPIVEAKMVIAMLDGFALHFILDPKHFPLEEIKKRLYQLI
ncbi:MAG TPA: TetR/AcrR family transcriptional regulator [Bacteroidales bacterium]|nr:TetR/AcrR family transcriptional regulator [Bacteroidales bacterium]